MGSGPRGEPSTDRILTLRARRWIEGNASDLLSLLAALLLLIPSLFNGEDSTGWHGRTWWWLTALVLAIVLMIVSVVWKVRIRPTREQLLAEADRLSEHQERWRRELREAVRVVAMELFVHTVARPTEARVTVYFHRDGGFVQVARASRNPKLDTAGRVRYPDNVGVIAQVWENGAAVVTGLSGDRDEWVRSAVEEYGLDPLDVENVADRMMSRSIVGKRLEHGRGLSGILLVESLSPRGVSGQTLDLLNGDEPLVKSLLSVLNEVLDVMSENCEEAADDGVVPSLFETAGV